MFSLMDGKEHRLLKELMTAKGDEGRTRVGHWIKGAGERVFVMRFICLEITQNVSFVWNTEEGKRRCSVTCVWRYFNRDGEGYTHLWTSGCSMAAPVRGAIVRETLPYIFGDEVPLSFCFATSSKPNKETSFT